MKSTIRSILFVLLVPVSVSVSACGGDRETSTVDPMSFMPKPSITSLTRPVAVAAAEPEAVKVPVAAAHVMPTKFDDALAQGRELVAKSDSNGARELFEAAIKLDKKRAEPHIELARMYIASGDRGLAMAAANKGVKLAPLSTLAWNTKGRAELARFDYDAAIEAFTKSVELSPDNVWAWNNLGYTELQLKKYDEAVSHLTEATSRKGATGFMFNNLGTALEQLDRLDEARAAFEAGGKLGSNEALASRKRLEGVKSLALAKTTADVPKPDHEKTFDLNEGKPVDEAGQTGEGSDTSDAPSDVPSDAPSDAGVPQSM
jgi:Flp pilus assembly protein TadD